MFTLEVTSDVFLCFAWTLFDQLPNGLSKIDHSVSKMSTLPLSKSTPPKLILLNRYVLAHHLSRSHCFIRSWRWLLTLFIDFCLYLSLQYYHPLHSSYFHANVVISNCLIVVETFLWSWTDEIEHFANLIFWRQFC